MVLNLNQLCTHSKKLHVWLSPEDNFRSQNRIFGFVDSTISPVSPLQGIYEYVSALIGATSSPKSAADLVLVFATRCSLTEQMQWICTLAHARFSNTSLKKRDSKTSIFMLGPKYILRSMYYINLMHQQLVIYALLPIALRPSVFRR